ncbi:hypothetical protein, partial [Aquimarina sp. AD1]|uniref:hypothetical protein n=1 Tax=Aquimarina sp. (strain AD1) TaxID=1714848 RepID=UPI001F3D8707
YISFPFVGKTKILSKTSSNLVCIGLKVTNKIKKHPKEIHPNKIIFLRLKCLNIIIVIIPAIKSAIKGILEEIKTIQKNINKIIKTLKIFCVTEFELNLSL